MCELCGLPLGATNQIGVCKRQGECSRELKRRWNNCLTEEQREEYRRRYRDRDASPEGHFRKLFQQAKTRAKNAGVPFDLTQETIPPVPDMCPCCDIMLKRDPKGPWRNQPSLDRIIPEAGYVLGNIQWLCRRCNQIKSNASPEELMRIALFVNGEEG